VAAGLIACVVAIIPLLPTPAAAATVKQAASFGNGPITWTSSRVVGHKVVVSQLPSIAGAATIPRLPLRVKDPAAYAAAKSNPAGAPGATPLAPRSVKTPSFAASFAGISE